MALGILNNNCQAGLALAVTIQNVGEVEIANRQLRITVSTIDGPPAGSYLLLPLLAPRAMVNIPTGELIVAPRTSVRIDLLGTPADGNPANDSADCISLTEPPTPIAEEEN